jgi:hypothetical protein
LFDVRNRIIPEFAHGSSPLKLSEVLTKNKKIKINLLMLRIKLNSDRFSKVSLARRFDLIGFSHPKASYFLLRRQKKVTKDKSVWNRFGCEARAARVPGRHESAGDPVAACILCSSLLCLLWVFDEGCQKGHPWPFWQRAASMQRPFGLLTRHISVPRPLGAMHANRLSCRFVSPKAAVLGGANGIKSSVRNIS